MPFDPAAWDNAESGLIGGGPPAPGEYETSLTDTDIISAKDGRQFAKLTYTVLSGFARDHAWGVVHTLDAINAQGDPNPGLAITKRTLRDLGVKVDEVRSVKELRDELERVRGGLFLVEVSRNGQHINTKPKRRLEGVQDNMSLANGGRTYGQPPPSQPANAIYGGDQPAAPTPAPPPGQGMLGPDEVRRDIERTGESDVTPAGAAAEFTAGAAERFDRSKAPKRGEIDPETGEEIPF